MELGSFSLLGMVGERGGGALVSDGRAPAAIDGKTGIAQNFAEFLEGAAKCMSVRADAGTIEPIVALAPSGATVPVTRPVRRRDGADRSLLAPTVLDRMLAAGAVVLLAAVLVALARGFGAWAQLPAALWIHILTILVALALTPVMMLRPRGDRAHRRLGRVWAAALFLTAAVSFLVRTAPDGGFSVIHLLSAFTLLQVPVIVWTARRHNWARHRRAVRAMVTGALLAAGFFTFPFGRLMGTWLFG